MTLLDVQAISSNSLRGDLRPIIQGILDLLSSVDSWKVKYIERDYNRVAHELAKLARDSGTTQFWNRIEPPMLQHLLLVDRSKC